MTTKLAPRYAGGLSQKFGLFQGYAKGKAKAKGESRLKAASPGKKKKKNKRPTLQQIEAKYPKARGPNKRCIAKSKSRSDKKQTPNGDPELCFGSVRLGNNPKYIYFATRYLKKNPKIKYSTVPTGQGYHMAFKWQKVYDARTKKPYVVTPEEQTRFLA
jgi:hypothetical protein